MNIGRSSCLGCCAVFGLTLCVLGVLTVVFFEDAVNFFIHKEMVICENCTTYDMWREPPVSPRTRIYFFNVTNPEDVLENGSQPILKEVGPFVYKEAWERVNLRFDNDSSTVTYQFKKIFQFSPDESVGPETLNITTINAPLATALHTVRHVTGIMRKAVGGIAKALKMDLMISRSVKDLLWGYKDPFIDLAKDTNPEQAPFDKFGFFYERNGTEKDVLTMYTGKDDIRKYGQLASVNGQTKLDTWGSNYCNMINGSDGSAYPPGTTKDTVLYMFQAQMCRSLPMVYEKEVKHNNITTYRFTPPVNVFGTVEENPDNECFCLHPPDCSDHGLFNISACKFGAPIMLSWPHFYNTDPRYLEGVVGLNPSKERHQFYMDIQPKLSMALQAKARMQINVYINPMDDIEVMQNITEVLLPVLWFESGVDKMPESILALVRQATEMPQVAEAAATYSLFILGGAIVVGVIFFIVRKRTSSLNSKVELSSIHNMTNNSNHNHHNGLEMSDKERTADSNGGFYPDMKPIN